MAPLLDPVIRQCFWNALNNRRFEGYVLFKYTAKDWIRQNLDGVSLAEVADLMFAHIDSGGDIDQQVETRGDWTEYGYHYDFRLQIDGSRIYIETVLLVEDVSDPDDPQIHVVSVHYV